MPRNGSLIAFLSCPVNFFSSVIDDFWIPVSFSLSCPSNHLLQAPKEQLFMLYNGKIYSAVDTSMCVRVQAESVINHGHDNSKLQFHPCSEQVKFGTFLHDRETPSFLQVANDADGCVKQHGPNAQTTDSLRAFECPANANSGEAGFVFEYREYNCNTNLGDVECCTNRNCRNAGETCQDYLCVCAVDPNAGIQCCSNADCNEGEFCNSDSNECLSRAPTGGCNTRFPDTECCEDDDCGFGENCVDEECVTEPRARCNVEHFGTDCCQNRDCPGDYSCQDKICISPAFFLSSVSEEDEDWCISVSLNDGEVQEEEAAFELCARRRRSRQEWHKDLNGRIRSNADFEKCLTIGPRVDTNGIVEARVASCDFNSALSFDAVANQMRSVFDPRYCLTSFDESEDGVIRCKPCENAGFLELRVL